MQNKKTEVQRNSSIEMLRIIAMAFIVLSHSTVHGCFPAEASHNVLNEFILDWFVLGNLGVDIFIMVSGYFLCTKSKQKIIPFISQVWFYSILYLIAYKLVGNDVPFDKVLMALFPTVFEEYWFFTAYFIFSLLLPYINIMIKNLNRAQFEKLITILMVLFSIIPTFINVQIYKEIFPQFLMCYLLGAYLKLYPHNMLERKYFRNVLTLLSFVFLFESTIIIRIFLKRHGDFFYERYSLPIVLCAMGLLAISVYHKKFVNKWINNIASCVFGIYLLHDNPFIRPVLWNKILANNRLYHSDYLLFALLFSVIIIFVAGILCEYIRKHLFEKYLLKLFMYIYHKMNLLGVKIGHMLRFDIDKLEEMGKQ